MCNKSLNFTTMLRLFIFAVLSTLVSSQSEECFMDRLFYGPSSSCGRFMITNHQQLTLVNNHGFEPSIFARPLFFITINNNTGFRISHFDYMRLKTAYIIPVQIHSNLTSQFVKSRQLTFLKETPKQDFLLNFYKVNAIQFKNKYPTASKVLVSEDVISVDDYDFNTNVFVNLTIYLDSSEFSRFSTLLEYNPTLIQKYIQVNFNATMENLNSSYGARVRTRNVYVQNENLWFYKDESYRYNNVNVYNEFTKTVLFVGSHMEGLKGYNVTVSTDPYNPNSRVFIEPLMLSNLYGFPSITKNNDSNSTVNLDYTVYLKNYIYPQNVCGSDSFTNYYANIDVLLELTCYAWYEKKGYKPSTNIENKSQFEYLDLVSANLYMPTLFDGVRLKTTSLTRDDLIGENFNSFKLIFECDNEEICYNFHRNLYVQRKTFLLESLLRVDMNVEFRTDLFTSSYGKIKGLTLKSASFPKCVVIQRRHFNDEKNLFVKTWQDYENGFADNKYTMSQIIEMNVQISTWIGLRQIHYFTNLQSRPPKLLVDINVNNYPLFAQYNSFQVGPASTNYTLNIRNFDVNSTAADGFLNSNSSLNGAQFSTVDVDNDQCSNSSCAQDFGNVGFWYTCCASINPNGKFIEYDYDKETAFWNKEQLYGIRMTIIFHNED